VIDHTRNIFCISVWLLKRKKYYLVERKKGMERPENEKRKKFVEFSNRRLKNAIQHIELIGKLANKGAYEYSNKDVKIIAEILNQSMEKTIAKLTDGKTEIKKWIE
jgi:hypothetical protein